jgi:UrcA family protein
MFTRTILAFTTAVVMSASVSQAAEIHTASVRTSDLNLASPAGVTALDQRIAEAAKLVCGPVDIKSTRSVAQWNECHQAAVSQAKSKAEAAIAAFRDGKSMASADLTISR